MLYEDERFIIYYNECDKRYLDLLISVLNKRIPIICNFFKKNFDKKIIIKLYNNIDEYKNNLINSFKKEAKENNCDERVYQDWMIANTEDGNINMQSLDLVKLQSDFRNYSEEEFCYNAAHEFTHLLQQSVDSKNPGWFWELIATNIGNPECQHLNNQVFTLDDLNNKFDIIGGYGIVYTFGKYIFDNYNHETILSWIKDNDRLMSEIEKVIEKYNKELGDNMIKTPEELLDFMSDFEYKWMDKDGNFHENITLEMYDDFRFLSPEEVKKYKCGICVDQAEFERDWFFRHNYSCKVMTIQIIRDDCAPGHTFLIYEDNNKYYWFENAWQDERGIYEYQTYEDLINDIKNKFIIQNDIKEDEMSNLEIFESIKYPYHLSYKEMDEYKYRLLLDDILKFIEEKHIDMYFNISKDELNKYIDEVLKKYPLDNEYDLYYVTNVIIKKIFDRFDSHTNLIWKNVDFYLPIKLKYIDNKLYIIKTDEDNKDILYGEILSINNIPLKDLINEIDNMTAYSTLEFLYSKIENILCNGFKLRSLPSIDSYTNEFDFEILKENKIIKRKLTKSNTKFYQNNNYSYKIIDGIMYIVYSTCREDYEGQMLDFINKISNDVDINNITKFIVDIRGNSGGNSNIIKPLINYLDGRQVITLVDKYVFSSGRFGIVDLKRIGSIFVGTKIGTILNCFGNVSRNQIDKYLLPVSNKYFYYDDKLVTMVGIDNKDDFIKFKNNQNNKEYFEPQVFKPDYYVENNIDDLKNNYDRQLEKTLELLNK